ncbi:5-formyltetrahydrofolate cyclo-ligase [Thermoplasmatales archaeon SG8-52-1]|nr:MAG: 5-formyltetrahydrofolate cyclo-ligase [Thermoplasmatales archaeon SG8-52-1]
MKEFERSSCIMFYVSYDNEVYTHDMIKEYLKNKKKVIVPVSDKKNRCLILSELNSWNDLKLGSYGILEPRADKIKKFPLEQIGLIIIPGVGYDEQGRRIGHGKGYYDNLLRNSKNALHIGLAFEIQIVKEIPVESHDISVDKIITEKRVIDCKKDDY